MEDLGHRAEVRGVCRLRWIFPGIIVPQMNHDLIFQLFYNLINNAIRYNKEGELSPLPPGKLRDASWTVHIKDTGVGIPPEELGTIFNRFKKSNRSEGEGYGLGFLLSGALHNTTTSILT